MYVKFFAHLQNQRARINRPKPRHAFKRKKILAQPCIAVTRLLSSRGGWIIYSVTLRTLSSLFLQFEINASIDACLARNWFTFMPQSSTVSSSSFLFLNAISKLYNYWQQQIDTKINNKIFASHRDMIQIRSCVSKYNSVI